MTLPTWTLPLPLLFLLSACGVAVNGPTPPEQPDIAGNNAATLTGKPLGSGETDAATLRKEVDVNLSAPNPDFELGTAYVTRTSAESDTAYWILPITNVGDEARCFVEVVDIAFRDNAGSTLSAEKDQFVEGSVGVLSPVHTDTCLAPRETGYVLGIQLGDNAPVYSALERIDIGSVEADTDTPAAPRIQVIPQGYSVSANQELAVEVENQGVETGYVSELSEYILLDSAERPLGWGFLDRAALWDGEIAPGEVRLLAGDVRYEGRAEAIRVITDFSDEPPSEMTAQSAAGIQADLARLRQRAAREEAKLEQLRSP